MFLLRRELMWCCLRSCWWGGSGGKGWWERGRGWGGWGALLFLSLSRSSTPIILGGSGWLSCAEEEALDVSEDCTERWPAKYVRFLTLSGVLLLLSVSTLSSSEDESLARCRSRDGEVAMTEVRFEGIGKDGLGLLCIAARACCTASWRTSVKNAKTEIKTLRVETSKMTQKHFT